MASGNEGFTLLSLQMRKKAVQPFQPPYIGRYLNRIPRKLQAFHILQNKASWIVPSSLATPFNKPQLQTVITLNFWAGLRIHSHINESGSSLIRIARINATFCQRKRQIAFSLCVNLRILNCLKKDILCSFHKEVAKNVKSFPGFWTDLLTNLVLFQHLDPDPATLIDRARRGSGSANPLPSRN